MGTLSHHPVGVSNIPLQMGHRLSTAETVSALIEAVLVELLQFGRGLSTAAT